MKQVILLRHAKSSWKDPDLQDMDRPLNRRGQSNACMMGERLFAQGVTPKRIFTSPAVRARETSERVAKVLGINNLEITLEPELYTFNYEILLSWMRSLDSETDNFLLTTHNPAITDLVNFLTLSKIKKIPTCGLVILKLNISSWHRLAAGSADIHWYDYPKSDGEGITGRVV